MSITAYTVPMSDLPEPDLDREIQRSIRLSERLWRKIRSVAGAEGKSANEWIAEQLERLVAPPDQDRKGGMTYTVNPHSASLCADRKE